ncbi:thioesterase family protein [Aromatoleum toluclasticum]|uniref:thioesterase family protein n=1 Tax=Aromatoleum toluclasticum TaxID=92003 RepID=UPI000590257E|nr:thioesterase family protein [Aromatoleum toluclasticum]MCC4114515.1 thioesterase family protein [Aromatoleum toluclasticum]
MHKSIALPEAFFQPLGDNAYQPTEATIGPWSVESQHGGPPIALLAQALRRFPSEFGLDIARITFEILGPVPVEPCELRVRVLRPGRRIELIQGEMLVRGKPVLLAHAWRVERLPESAVAVADPFAVPPLPEAQAQVFFHGVDYFPYADALEWRFADGSFIEPGPATVWARPRIPLVAGQPTDGIEALLLILDSANGISAELDIRHWTFVPVDLTINMHRHPTGEWFGMSARTIIDTGGIGTVTTAVFDRDGALGRSLHTLFVRKK